MNEKYAKINNEEYIVLDENKKISIVKSSNVNLEEILNIENKIESEKLKYEECINKINEINSKLEIKKKYTNYLYGTEIVLLILGLITNLFGVISLFVLTSFFITKGILYFKFGGLTKNTLQEFKYKVDKDNCLLKIDKLEHELELKKSLGTYKKEELADIIENNIYLDSKENDIQKVPQVKKYILKP